MKSLILPGYPLRFICAKNNQFKIDNVNPIFQKVKFILHFGNFVLHLKINLIGMITRYFLAPKWKILGWSLFLIGILSGLFFMVTDYSMDFREFKFFAIVGSDSVFSSREFFKWVENDPLDEILSLFVIVGGLIVAFSRQKVEDEFINKLRIDSLLWAILTNYAILILAIVLVFDMAFFDVLVINMFTTIVFYIFRFHFLYRKYLTNEE